MMPLALLRKYRRIYLASPYSLHRGGRDAACAEAAKIAGELISEGIRVFSPIAHSHTICEHSDLDPLDHELWMDQDESFMEDCDALVIVQFSGWDSSYGIEMEKQHFRDANKPVHFLDTVKMELR